MDFLERTVKQRRKEAIPFTPTIFDISKQKDRRAFISHLKKRKIQWVADDYEEQQRELFAINNPTLAYSPDFDIFFGKHMAGITRKRPLVFDGKWVYFPWLSTVSHILSDKDFQLVRTARNRNLINKEEQRKFYDAVIGIAGLSVGSNVALAIALQGGGRHIRLADHDRLALSNTNRIRAGVQNLGARKVELVARQIYEIDPYATVEIFTEGLTAANIRRFFAGPPKLDIVVDEVDHLGMKYLIREHAKKNRLAVVMAADNGDSAVVDVERYDHNPSQKFFHGRLGKTSYEQLAGLGKFEIGKMITKHVGPENVTERMRESLLEMGKTIVSWPQLGGAAMLSGASVAYCVRKILNGEPLEHDRGIISLDEKLVPHYNAFSAQRKRKRTADAFKKIFGL